ncbi:MAG TPA: hypothetical protein VLH79_15240 [Chthonomonadales bacterium]|nr:hypothetical protein [Chthonomonadales bacterium]
MRCRQFSASASEHVAGRLDAALAAGMERHAAECARCAAELRAERRLRSAFAAVDCPVREIELRPALAACLATGAAPMQRPARAWLRPVFALAGGAGLALVLALLAAPRPTVPVDSAAVDETHVIRLVADMQPAPDGAFGSWPESAGVAPLSLALSFTEEGR